MWQEVQKNRVKAGNTKVSLKDIYKMFLKE